MKRYLTPTMIAAVMSIAFATASAAAAAQNGAILPTDATMNPPPVDPLDDRSMQHEAMASAEFKLLDADQDGLLSNAEVAADASLAAEFSNYDTDADGKLSATEYRSYERESVQPESDNGDGW